MNLKSWKLYIFFLLFNFLPETRFFGLKASVLRWVGAEIGSNVRVCSSVKIIGQGPLKIGDNVWIGPQSLLVASAAISIGSNVDIAPGVYIGTGTHEIDREGLATAGKGVSQKITISNGVWIGARSVIISGITIGEKALIAAGAVVTRDVPNRTVVGGTPARQIGTV